MTTSVTPPAVLMLVNLLVLALPGLAVTVAAGLPRWTALAAAPLITYGLVALTGPVVSAAGGTWGPGWLAAAAAVLTLLALATRVGLRHLGGPVATGADTGAAADAAAGHAVAGEGDRAPQRPAWLGRGLGDLAMLAGIVAGGVIGARTALLAMGSLDGVNQHWDAIFHANAVRFILDSGDADPAALRAVNDFQNQDFFYPNSYHVLAATVGKLTDVTIPALLNSQFLLLAGVTGLGLAALVRRFGGGVGAAAAVAVLVPAFSAFPNDLLDWGPVLPYATGTALVPALLVVVADQLRDRRPAGFLVLAVGAVGLLGVHPAAAVTVMVFLVLYLGLRWARDRAVVRSDLVVLALSGAFALAVGYRYAIGALGARTSAVVDWPTVGSPGAMLGILLTLNEGKQYPQAALVVLMVLGLTGWGRLRELRWFLLGGAVFSVLFVMAASYEGRWVALLTGPWWNDRWRLGAVVALPMMVLAGYGVVRVAEGVAAVLTWASRQERVRPVSFAAAVLIALIAVGWLTNGFYRTDNAERMSIAYIPTRSVSTAEAAGLRELATLVPVGSRVMNDPYDGSALMYALNDIRPMFGHVIEPGSVSDLGPDQRLLLTRFHCLDTDPQVRSLVDKYDIQYVFLGNDFVVRRLSRAEGLTSLTQLQSLQQVYDRDGVSIFRVLPPAGGAGTTAQPPDCRG